MAEDTHGMGIPLPADSTPIHQYPKVARQMGEKVAEILAGGMTEGATEAVNKAVPPAVAKAITAADLVRGDDARLPRKADLAAGAEPLLAAITDGTGRMSWLSARLSDGGPTDWAVQQITERLGVGPRTAERYLFAVTDQDKNLTDLAIRESDGQFADFVIDRLRHRITGGRQYADTVYSRGAELFPVRTDSRRVAGWGSSSMERLDPWLGPLFAGLGAAYYAGGKGAELAEHTAARMGARPALVTVPGGVIPASGAVDIAVSNMQVSSFLRSYPGTLAGVPGTLAHKANGTPAGTLTFTRTTAGTAVRVDPETPFIPTADSYRDAVTLLWIGKNNLGVIGAEKTLVEITNQCFDWLAPFSKRCLVFGHFLDTGTPADSREREQQRIINAALKARYGRLYVDIDAWATGPQVWKDTGITPTQADIDAQQLGCLPPSISEDAAHFSAAVYDVIARKLVAPRLVELNWY